MKTVTEQERRERIRQLEETVRAARERHERGKLETAKVLAQIDRALELLKNAR